MFNKLRSRVKRTLLKLFEIFSNKVLDPDRIRDPFYRQKFLTNNCGPLTIFDVGAYIGTVALGYNDIFPGSEIHCFEPYPGNYKKLCENVKGRPSIKPFQLAVSDKDSSVDFFVNSGWESTSSLFERSQYGRRYYPNGADSSSRIEVRAITLDYHCEKNAINKIDILKMDIQGGELSALRGAQKLLKGNKISVLFLEVMFIPHYKDAPLFRDIEQFLAQYGYSLYNIYSLSHGKNGQLRHGDAIFVSEMIRNNVLDKFHNEP
ncbi:MAG: FkbM family methyltransferase [Candidatus Omnitrophica bacterium]|nr:FkbM family methyltransferase [Candidatus Omnitrophota bacterium]